MTAHNDTKRYAVWGAVAAATIAAAGGSGVSFAQGAGLEPQGVRFGAFRAFPELRVGLVFDDNVFAEDGNRSDDDPLAQDDESGVAREITSSVRAESGWSRHTATANASIAHRSYFDIDQESFTNINLGAQGRYDLGLRTGLNASISQAFRDEDREDAGSPAGALEPLSVDDRIVSASVDHTFNRIQLTGSYVRNERDYDDVQVRTFDPVTEESGVAISDQDFRDITSESFSLRGAYGVTPDLSVFLSGTLGRDDFDFDPASVVVPEGEEAPFDRDADDVVVQIGASFDVTDLINGSAAIGYQERDFDDARFDSESGVSAQASVEWLLTPLTTATFTGSRTIDESPFFTDGGVTRTSGAAQVRHELRRNLNVNARLALISEEFTTLGTDDIVQASIGGEYFLNRRIGVGASYRRSSRDSTTLSPRASFDRNLVGLNLVARY